MRTALAVLGMTVAIMGMVSLFSIAEGLNRAVGNTLNRVPGFVAMQRGAPIPLFSTLPRDWLPEMEAIPGVYAVSPECWARANVIEGKVIVSPPRLVCGVDIERRNRLRTAVYREDIVAGRFLETEDVGSMNCVVSRQIAEEFKKGLGDTLEVNGYEFQIVGLYYTGSMLLDVAILIDETPFREMARFDQNTVSSYYIEQDSTVPDRELLSTIQEHFRGRGLKTWQAASLFSAGSANPLTGLVESLNRLLNNQPAETPDSQKSSPVNSQSSSTPATSPQKSGSESSVEADAMEVRLATDWAGRIDKFAEDLDMALWLLTSVGLFVAVISVINTMLMSVAERVSEFGILRANGWSKWDLMQLIAWESLLLGLAGGILGSLLGWLLTLGVNTAFPQRFSLYASPSLLMFALVFSALLGVLSGLYPALWAARLNPMEAIRRN